MRLGITDSEIRYEYKWQTKKFDEGVLPEQQQSSQSGEESEMHSLLRHDYRGTGKLKEGSAKSSLSVIAILNPDGSGQALMQHRSA